MNKKLLAIASLCAFSLAACESTGKVKTDFTEMYRLHTPNGVIETSDPEVIAAYRTQPGTTIVALGETPMQQAIVTAEKSKPSAP